MTSVSYYVLHDGQYYSYEYLHDTKEEAEADCGARDELALVRPLDLDQRYYAVYAAEPVTRPDSLSAAVDLTWYDESAAKIIGTVIKLFGYIEDEQELEWYKPLEPDRVADAINRVQWRGSVSNVGGQLLSRLILAHALPNANHRTSIAFLQTYFESFGSPLEEPQTNVGDEWADWANGFIEQSKRLLLVRRKAREFQYLSERGATAIEYKDDLTIRLDQFDLDIDDPWTHYRHRHEAHSQTFVAEYLRRAGGGGLAEREDPGMSVLADRLPDNYF